MSWPNRNAQTVVTHTRVRKIRIKIKKNRQQQSEKRYYCTARVVCALTDAEFDGGRWRGVARDLRHAVREGTGRGEAGAGF